MSQIGNTYEPPFLGVGQHPRSLIHVVLISDWNEHLLPVYRRWVTVSLSTILWKIQHDWPRVNSKDWDLPLWGGNDFGLAVSDSIRQYGHHRHVLLAARWHIAGQFSSSVQHQHHCRYHYSSWNQCLVMLSSSTSSASKATRFRPPSSMIFHTETHLLFLISFCGLLPRVLINKNNPELLLWLQFSRCSLIKDLACIVE